MCEYCGCQDIAAIRALTDEHDDLREVGGEARLAAAAGDWTRAQQASRELTRLLLPHTEVEERGLFPAMAAEFPEHVESLLEDHRHLDAVFAEIGCAAQPPQLWADRLDHALRDLVNHILREQDGLFPAALSVLDPAEWDLLEEVGRQVRHRPGVASPA